MLLLRMEPQMVTITHDEFGTVEADDMKSAQKKLRALEREHKKQQAAGDARYRIARMKAESAAFHMLKNYHAGLLHGENAFCDWRIVPVGAEYCDCQFDPDDNFTGHDRRTITIRGEHGIATTREYSEDGRFEAFESPMRTMGLILQESTGKGAGSGSVDVFFAIGIEGDQVALVRLPNVITRDMFLLTPPTV